MYLQLDPTKPITTTPLLKFVFLTLITFFTLPALHAQNVLMGVTTNGGVEGKGTLFTIKIDTKAFQVARNFADWGSSPEGDLVRGTDGFLYGMTESGGTYGNGTLFRIATTGGITILRHFNIEEEGGHPKGGIIQAKDGNFYGLLSSGGDYQGGSVFRLTPSGTFSVIRHFNINADGGRPRGNLVQGTDGNFYGIHTHGGTFNGGTIFKMTPDGQYSVLKMLSSATDGAQSEGSLVQATDGALYGMTQYGGTYGYGVIFRITTTGTYKVLKHLTPATDAAYPTGDLIQAKDGYLYGMAPKGIAYNGVIFKIKMDGTGFVLLHQMAPATEGGNPLGSLKQGSDGNFYGLTYLGGGSGYSGTAFKMNSSGTLTVIRRFTEATDGGQACGSLIQAPDGALYGMTYAGGKNLKGTIFRLTTGGSYSVLAHLNGSNTGNAPAGNVAIGKDSAYFGITRAGGTYNNGTIYKTCGGVTTVLRSLNRPTDGESPVGGLLRATDGNLYGMTENGGTNGFGTIFRITPTGTFTVLRHMSATDGTNPQGRLVQGNDGLLYGVAYSGGTNGNGTIFRLTAGGTGFTVLRHLVTTTDGNKLLMGLTKGTDGALYGMTSSNTRFFKITPTGEFVVIKALTYSTDGGSPAGELVQGTDGNFYGTMRDGGPSAGGVIFRISAAGTFTRLRYLTPATDGGTPKGSLVQGSDGAFYGTTSTGGTYKAGTIFRIEGTTFTVLRHFNIATDGGMPMGGLIITPKVVTTANSQTGLTTPEDVAKAITLTGSGATNLNYTIITQPRNGTISSGTGASRTYTPKANFNGVDSFAFTANLGCVASAPAWVKITVTLVNDAPVLAAIGSKTVVKGTLLKFTATATDVDAGQTRTFTL
ncbi:choice-of-anchor tandem repeat GloVer-containing protein, partial [Cnuella takakiae]